MKKIVLLSGDPKLRRELSQWLKELAEETLVEAYAEEAEFKKLYFRKPPEPDQELDKSPQNSGQESEHTDAQSHEFNLLEPQQKKPAEPKINRTKEAKAGGSDDSEKKPIPVSVLVIDLEYIEDQSVAWVHAVREELKALELSDPLRPTRVMLLGYEGHSFSVERFCEPEVDDFLFKPIDKSLFLQKVELHLLENNSIRPSFLFKQKTEIAIEIVKDIEIEGLSEFGLVINNPAPLKSGVFTKIYSPVFGGGQIRSVYARVYRSEEHPAKPGRFLVFLSFFGINHDQLVFVRKQIKPDRHQQKSVGAAKGRAPSGAERGAIIIDMDSDARDLITESLQANFSNIEVRAFPSYSSFLKYCARHLPGGTNHQTQTSGPAAISPFGGPIDPTDPAHEDDVSLTQARLTLGGASEIAFLVDANSLELKSIEPMPRRNANILGIGPTELLDRGAGWAGIFGPAVKEEIVEFMAFVRSGQTGQMLASYELNDGDDIGTVFLKIRGRLERSGENDGVAIARVTLREIEPEEWHEQYKRSHVSGKVQSVDAVFIDGSLLGEDPASTLEGLREVLFKTGMVRDKEGLRITVLGDERSRISPETFRLPIVTDFVFKPVDRKSLLDKAALFVDGLDRKTNVIDLTHKPMQISGRLAKEVIMEELSEFGLQIRHNSMLREQTFLRFYSSVFLDEKGQGILGRCMFCGKNQDTGQYQCFFAFFGVSDAQLKHIRKWIRGDYAAKKEKSGGA